MREQLPQEWTHGPSWAVALTLTTVAVCALLATQTTENATERAPSRHPAGWFLLARRLVDSDAFLRPELWLLLVLLPALAWLEPAATAKLRAVLLLGVAVAALRGGQPMTRRRAWPLLTLTLSVGICASYWACGAKLSGSTNNDAAYYFAVARHIAATGRFEEPIVWHHLVHREGVTHAPFDYWPALPSLWLVPLFKIFGASPKVLGLAAASVSCASVLLFWFFVSVQRPLGSGWLQLTSLLLFAYSPPLWDYRFDAETVPWTHVWILASLIALSRRKPVAAVICGFLLFLSRPDCVALSVLVWVFSWLIAREAQQLKSVALTCVAAIAAYCGYHELLFGTLTPPGAALAPRLIDGMELYRFRETGPLLQGFQHRFTAEYFDARAHAAFETLRSGKFVPLFHVWLLLALAGGARAHWRADRSAQAAWLMLPIGALAPSLASPMVFAEWRTLHPLLPLLLLVASHALDSVLVRARAFSSKLSGLRRLAPHALTVAACGFSLLMLQNLKPYLAPPTPPQQAQGPTALKPYFEGKVVMSLFPWFVLADANTPAVGLPSNGPDAVRAAIERYRVDWLMIPSNGNCQDDTDSFCHSLVANAGAELGTIHLRYERTGADAQLFRVEKQPAARVLAAPPH